MIEVKETKKIQDQNKIRKLIGEFHNQDGMKRRHARLSVTKIGKAATPFLIEALKDNKEDVRWEAAKALVDIKDPKAASVLVSTLMDNVFEIRWLAAEALIALGRSAIVPILEALRNQSDSVSLREGAHHILHDLERKQKLDKPVLDVLESLRSLGCEMEVVLAAEKALDFLKKKGHAIVERQAVPDMVIAAIELKTKIKRL